MDAPSVLVFGIRIRQFLPQALRVVPIDALLQRAARSLPDSTSANLEIRGIAAFLPSAAVLKVSKRLRGRRRKVNRDETFSRRYEFGRRTSADTNTRPGSE